MTIDEIIDIGIELKGYEKNDNLERFDNPNYLGRLMQIKNTILASDPVDDGLLNLLKTIIIRDLFEQCKNSEDDLEVLLVHMRTYIAYKEMAELGKAVPIPDLIHNRALDALEVEKRYPEQLFHSSERNKTLIHTLQRVFTERAPMIKVDNIEENGEFDEEN